MNVDHLNPDTLARAQRHLVAKAIAEFAHERLLEPRSTTGDGYSTPTSPRRAADVPVRGAARYALDHWVLDAASLKRQVDGRPADLDVQEFVVEFAERLGIPDALLPTYLEELASTLASAAWKLHHQTATVGRAGRRGLPGRSRPR